MNFFREIPLFCAPEYIMDYYHKHKYSYLLAGIHCAQAHDGRIGFLNRQDCDVFQKRVFHLRMRNEMKEAYDKMTEDEKSSFGGACIEVSSFDYGCTCYIFDCHHMDYKDVEYLYNIVFSKKKEEEEEEGPPPLVYGISPESKRKYNALPKSVQDLLLPNGKEAFFDTKEEADAFEKKVVEKEMLKHQEKKLADFYGRPRTYFLGETAQRIVAQEKKDIDHKDVFYIHRVTCLLHSVAALAAQNKSLTQELVGSPLQTFAAFLVKTRVEEFGLKMFEDTIRIATDPKNPFSLLFANYDKLTPPQKCIVKGLLGIMDKKEGEPWIHDAATQCLLLKEDGVDTKVLMEFLK